MATIAVLGALAASCARDTQSEPETIDRREVPFGLTEAEPPGTADSATPLGFPSSVYLVGADRLVPVQRVLDFATARERVRALLEGPTEDERGLGVRTAVPSGTTLRHLDVRGGRATIDLGGEFDRASGEDRAAAVAQLVYTVTEDPRVALVRFEFDGRSIEVPTAAGELTARAVRRDDYPADGLLTRG